MTPSTTAARCAALPCSNMSRSTSRTSVIRDFRDGPVHLRPPVPLEIEDRAAVRTARVEIAFRHDHFVAIRRSFGNHFAGRRDDLAFGERIDAFLHAALRDTD